jgi:hypothetical protein
MRSLATSRFGIASLAALRLLHLQSICGHPHPAQILPCPVEYTSLGLSPSPMTRS